MKYFVSPTPELRLTADTPLLGENLPHLHNSPERCLTPLVSLKYEYGKAQICYQIPLMRAYLNSESGP